MEWIFVAGVLVYIVLGILVGGGKADLFMGLFVYNYKNIAHMYVDMHKISVLLKQSFNNLHWVGDMF